MAKRSNASKPLKGLLVRKSSYIVELDLSLFKNLSELDNLEHIKKLKRDLINVQLMVRAIDSLTGWEQIKGSNNFIFGQTRSFTDTVDLFRQIVSTFEDFTLATLREATGDVYRTSIEGLEGIRVAFVNEIVRLGKIDALNAFEITDTKDYMLARNISRELVEETATDKIIEETEKQLEIAVSRFKEIKANSDYSKEFELQLKTKKDQEKEQVPIGEQIETVAEKRSQTDKYKNRWFWGLLIIGFIYSAGIVLSVFMETPENNLYSNLTRNISSLDELIIKFVISLPLIIIFLKYAQYSRLFKVYSNLEEQYRHKNLVAKTTGGLLKAFESGDVQVDPELLQKLKQEAAKSIMEQKSIGHLGGKESPGFWSFLKDN